MADGSTSVRFWGVRGTLSCPGADTLRYGGNTSCVELRHGQQLIILDAGTGLSGLGKQLLSRGQPVTADLLLTHPHLDHVAGLPFFAPLYSSGTTLRIWGGSSGFAAGCLETVRRLFGPPLFPLTLEEVKARAEFCDFVTGETFQLGADVTVLTRPLHHPGGATGYRVETSGGIVAYVTDTEHPEGSFDPNVLALAAGADLLIYDATYTEEEYAAHKGWGHSTWAHGVRLAEQAEAKTLVIFHHEPDHDDSFMDRIAAEAHYARPGTIVAREGLCVPLRTSSARDLAEFV